MKLSKVQARALAKLTNNWQCAYDLKENLATLHALARRGLADVNHEPGSLFSPPVHIMFRKAQGAVAGESIVAQS